MPSYRLKTLCIALFVGALSAGTANASEPAVLDRLLKTEAGSRDNTTRLSIVREEVLGSTARALGTQAGLIERSKEIANMIESRKVSLEKTFRFGDLVIGAGVLPPVIIHTNNAQSIQPDAMRVAGSMYRIVQPARFFSGAPSWRDWLTMGLMMDGTMPELPRDEQLLPRDAIEKAYWQKEIRAAYQSGRNQADEIFENNLASLEETYTGMRVFYDLYQRKMVSAPKIAKSQEILTREGDDTIIVGDTLFRITVPSQFESDPSKWAALASVPMPTHVLLKQAPPGFDPEQVRQAFEVYSEQQRQMKAQQAASAQAGGKQGLSGAPAVRERELAPVAQTGVVNPAAPVASRPISAGAPVQSTIDTPLRVNPEPPAEILFSPDKPLFGK